MAQRIKLIGNYIAFLKRVTGINIRLRYHGTLFGFFWTVLNAFAMITIFTFVFGYILKVPLENFPVFLFCGYLPWLFFSSCMINSCHSILKSSNLLQKAWFPREILVFSEVLAQLAVNISSLFIFILCFGLLGWLRLTPEAIVLLPLLLLIQTMISLGLGLMLALVNVFFRDVAYFVEILIMIWFYLTPIFYPLSWVPERVRHLIRLNPITYIIEAYRHLFYMKAEFSMHNLAYPAILGLVLLVLGWRIFLVHESRIVEEL